MPVGQQERKLVPFTIEVEGLKELSKSVRLLEAAGADSELSKMMRARMRVVAKIMRDEVKELAPIATRETVGYKRATYKAYPDRQRWSPITSRFSKFRPGTITKAHPAKQRYVIIGPSRMQKAGALKRNIRSSATRSSAKIIVGGDKKRPLESSFYWGPVHAGHVMPYGGKAAPQPFIRQAVRNKEKQCIAIIKDMADEVRRTLEAQWGTSKITGSFKAARARRATNPLSGQPR